MMGMYQHWVFKPVQVTRGPVTPQLFTLLGTVVGAAIGLFAPVITTALAHKSSKQDNQRDLADQIMNLFADGSAPASLLHEQQNSARRRLYLLAIKLNSAPARDACMRFIACAGRSDSSSPGADGLAVYQAWEQMMTEVAAIYRGRNARGQIAR